MDEAPSTMRAVQVHATGGPDVLRVESIPVPRPRADEALMRVEASSVSFTDVYKRTGLYQIPLAAALGEEGAGTVVDVGEDVHDVVPPALGVDDRRRPARSEAEGRTGCPVRRPERSVAMSRRSRAPCGRPLDGSRSEYAQRASRRATTEAATQALGKLVAPMQLRQCAGSRSTGGNRQP